MAKLQEYIERIERLEEEKKDVQCDIKGVYSEAKSQGYDKKALKAVIKLRKMDAASRQNYEAALDAYMAELGE